MIYREARYREMFLAAALAFFLIAIAHRGISASSPETTQEPVQVSQGITQEVVAPNDQPLLISWYNPHLGGINCMDPCDMMASGHSIYGEYGFGVGAACVPDWPFGTQVTIKFDDGARTFVCQDRGGAIQRIPDGIWIDLLLEAPIVPYRTPIWEYNVVFP